MEGRRGRRQPANGNSAWQSRPSANTRVWSLTRPPGLSSALPRRCRSRLAAVWHRHLEFHCIDVAWRLARAGQVTLVAAARLAERCAAWVARACAGDSVPTAPEAQQYGTGHFVADAPAWGGAPVARKEPASATDAGVTSAR